jgi:uncharacterized membrane protein
MYADRMDRVTFLLIGLLVLVLLPLVGVGRFVWRVWHGNEEMESGGSYGRQLSRRD